MRGGLHLGGRGSASRGWREVCIERVRGGLHPGGGGSASGGRVGSASGGGGLHPGGGWADPFP